MRQRFAQQLDELNNELITMGALCEEAIENSVKYLFDSEKALRETVEETEKQINQKEREIESICMRLLMQQQPVASDLRVISSALKMISDMERIGDQALDIASIAIYIENSGISGKVHIADMAKETMKMVGESINAFVKKDIKAARNVIHHDDVVDNLFKKVKHELIEEVQKGGDDAEALVDMVMVAKYFERIGDHAENIAEWVIYSITGSHIYAEKIDFEN
ncbi:MAG: phosphate signaling complex protein PhoU [Clostridia bacterium]|nr:phosphate signaling complex protein PhoU [Clostridia bacterium]